MSSDPTTSQPRVIVLCFDGTADQYAAANTNVVKLYALLDKCCPLEQIVYYQPGIGTFFNPGVVSPALTWIAKIADEAVAWYLNEHVMGGYKFLMQNYRTGDKICIFGFSRGAYTARALAGLLYKIGLLPKDNEEQVPFAYKLYKREDDAGLKLAAGFKQTFCTSVTIDFIGVWDTVASVGIIYGRSLPFTSANAAVRIFRQALALDEHRARFQPNMFHRESPQDAARFRKDSSPPVSSDSANPKTGQGASPRSYPRFGLARWSLAAQRRPPGEPHKATSANDQVPSDPIPLSPQNAHSALSSATPNPPPPVLEVWFVGCHTDVGGSSVPDTVRCSLSDITLRWMVKQVVLANCGIKFDETALKEADIDVSTIALDSPTQPALNNSEVETEAALPTPQALPNSPGDGESEEHMIRRGVQEQDLQQKQDAMAPIYDQLKIQPLWWLLELLPIKSTWQEADGTWKSKWSINFGRGRTIRDEHPNFHVSVRQRIAASELNYKPRATWTAGSEQYVE